MSLTHQFNSKIINKKKLFISLENSLSAVYIIISTTKIRTYICTHAQQHKNSNFFFFIKIIHMFKKSTLFRISMSKYS